MDDMRVGRGRFFTGLVVGIGLALVVVALFRVPLATVFGFGVLLICPLLMMGMHSGHGGDSNHGGRSHSGRSTASDRADVEPHQHPEWR